MVTFNSHQPAAQNSFILKQVWEKIGPDSCPHSYNFHLHTVCSDGRLTVSDLMTQAVNIGLKGMAITDHHSTKGYQLAQTWLDHAHNQKSETILPYLWTGVEISANLIGVPVHLLGYAFDPENPALQPYLQGKTLYGADAQAERVIDALHEAGGLAVLAHPARYRYPVQELITAAADLNIDGVETYYCYNNSKPWQPSPKQSQKIAIIGEQFGLYHTCGTDTHGLNLLERI
jgi:predicted metal-dependent phosphoesterase TrpH